MQRRLTCARSRTPGNGPPNRDIEGDRRVQYATGRRGQGTPAPLRPCAVLPDTGSARTSSAQRLASQSNAGSARAHSASRSAAADVDPKNETGPRCRSGGRWTRAGVVNPDAPLSNRDRSRTGRPGLASGRKRVERSLVDWLSGRPEADDQTLLGKAVLLSGRGTMEDNTASRRGWGTAAAGGQRGSRGA